MSCFHIHESSKMKPYAFRLDYVATWNEVDVLFHTDYVDSASGFELVWRAVDVSTCIPGRTLLAGIGYGFPLQETTIHSPNFPYFNLPRLDCVYTIVAPGKSMWRLLANLFVCLRAHVLNFLSLPHPMCTVVC